MLPEPIQDDFFEARLRANASGNVAGNEAGIAAGDMAPASSARPISHAAAERLLTPEILSSEGYGPGPGASNETSRPSERVRVVEGGIPADLGSGDIGPQERGFGARAHAAAARFDELVREDPRRAVGLAAVVGFGLGASLFATPLVRVLVGGVASVAMQSDGAKRIYRHVGAGLVDRLESMLA